MRDYRTSELRSNRFKVGISNFDLPPERYKSIKSMTIAKSDPRDIRIGFVIYDTADNSYIDMINKTMNEKARHDIGIQLLSATGKVLKTTKYKNCFLTLADYGDLDIDKDSERININLEFVVGGPIDIK